MELITLAKYPFLKESKKYLRECGPSLEELINDIAFSTARTLGKSRVLHSLEKVEEYEFSTTAECINELLSYVVARIIVSCAKHPYIIKWYAQDEATRISNRLENEDIDFLINVAQELDIDAKKDEKNAKIHFTDYLKNASSLKSKKWKLINQELINGYVVLEKTKLARILREVLRTRFESELPLQINKEIKKAFEKDVSELRKKAEIRKTRFETKDLGKVSPAKFPPCIQHIFTMLQSGINVPHQSRFALTAFLHNIGMNENQILKLYTLSPDFDESKAFYQIRHITGQISGTKYRALACRAMKTYGICYGMDELCKFISHPIGYYEIKKRIYSPRKKFLREVLITIHYIEGNKEKFYEKAIKLYDEISKVEWRKPIKIVNFKKIENLKEKKAMQIKVKVTKINLKSSKVQIGEEKKYFVYSQPIFEDINGNKIQSLAIIDWDLITKLIAKNNKFVEIIGINMEIRGKIYFYVNRVSDKST